MHVAGNTAGPDVVIPGWKDVEPVPAIAYQGRGTVTIVFQQKLPAQYIDVSHDFGVLGLPHDVKCQIAMRLVSDNRFIKDVSVAKDAFSASSLVVTLYSRRHGTWHAELEEPIVVLLFYFFKSNDIFPYFLR